jgi:hypothetical protein
MVGQTARLCQRHCDKESWKFKIECGCLWGIPTFVGMTGFFFNKLRKNIEMMGFLYF